MKSAQLKRFTGRIGAPPSSPPNSAHSPSFLPITGIRRTAVVLLFTIPIANSSAIIPLRVVADVSPGTAIISRPTEQTVVIASSFSMQIEPCFTALIIPSSSETGINAPESPPTFVLAITPPFFTISVSIARAAVVPGAPAPSRPHSSRIRATESPTAGVGARERSRMPKLTPRRCAASEPTSCPIRVILKAIFFIPSASSFIGRPLYSRAAARITPGPETPTLITLSPSPGP